MALAGVYEGVAADSLGRALEVPRVVAYDSVSSTLDVAHALAAEGAAAGTLVIADAQTAGRGRMGRTWTSEHGAGVWLTVIERPREAKAIELLSLRIGIVLAPTLDRFTDTPVALKWPNDIYVGGRKLAGILVEARWRDAAVEWVAIGVGINVRPPPGEERAAGLRPGTSRLDVLAAVVPAIRDAASRRDLLSPAELETFERRDLARGLRCVAPVAGRVRGVDAEGALLIDTPSDVVAVRAGSLVLTEEQ